MAASFLYTAAALGVTVEGRTLRLEAGAFVAEDAAWLAARVRTLLRQREYGRANDIATLLAAAPPPEETLAARALSARAKYFAVGHKEAYVAFRDLYRAEKKRREAGGAAAPLSDDDRARLAIITREATATLGAAYGAGAVQGPKKISRYDSPTANTGVAEPQASRYDLRWSVNLLFLIKKYDPQNVTDAKGAVKAALDERRTYKAFFSDVSVPKSTRARAVDDVRGSALSRARKMLPAALSREIQNTYNLEGFKFCIQRPVGIPELTAYISRIIKVGETEEIKVTRFEDAGFVAYRATATVRGEATTSLADVLRYFDVAPYTWRPFVGKLEKEKKAPPEEARREGAAAAGEIPPAPAPPGTIPADE